MLEKFLQIKLPYPPDQITLVFYNIRCEQNDLMKYLVYNHSQKQLEFPFSKLGSNQIAALKEKAWERGKFRKQHLRGTDIYWWIKSQKLCFCVK